MEENVEVGQIRMPATNPQPHSTPKGTKRMSVDDVEKRKKTTEKQVKNGTTAR